MGLLENLKDFYFSLEDKYYSLLDALDEKGLPVYAVIDPIDKVVPSFALLLILILIGVGWLVWTATPTNALTLTVSVTGSDGTAAPNVPLDIELNGKLLQKTTNASGKTVLTVPQDSTAIVTLDLEGFEPVSKTVLIQSQSVSEQLVLNAIAVPQTRFLQFVDESGFAVTQAIQLRLSCSTPGIELADDTVSTDNQGQVTIIEPVGCGTLMATVLGPANFQSDSFAVNQPSSIFRLEGVDATDPEPLPQTLPIRLRIQDEQGRLLTGIEFEALLYKNGIFQKSTLTKNGKARFEELEPGTYKVSVSDKNGSWAGEPVDNIAVSQTTPAQEITITLHSVLAIQLTAQVLDEDTLQPIGNATVIFKNKLTGIEIERKKTNASGSAVPFSLVQPLALRIESFADNYFSGFVETTQTTGLVKILLQKITAQSEGKVRVQVLDDAAKPVINARVFLRYADTETIAPYPEQSTDENGEAVFMGVNAEELFAYAEKYPASGQSESQTIDPTMEAHFTINLQIGDAELTINAFDEHNELIPGANVEIWSSQNEFLGNIPLANGTKTYKTRADKRIFLVITHPDYFGFQTETFQLFKDNPRTVNAILPSRLLGGGPQAVLLGVFDAQDHAVQKMQAGGNYFVRLQLRVPENANYKKAGIHFRVGNTKLMDNDSIIITGINVGNASVTRGTSFNEQTGNVVDLAPEQLSTGDAKWVEFSWHNPIPRAYNAVVKVHVKNTTAPNSAIPMYYRAWAETQENKVIRDPVDSELGENFHTDSKQALYANARAVVSYFEGQDSECTGDFCFSNLRVFDQTEGLFLLREDDLPFETKINLPYQLSFILTNNSPTDYSDAILNIKALLDSDESNELKFTGYSITNASEQTVSNASPSGSTIADIGVGAFKTNAGISGTIDFIPTTLNPTEIEITLVFEGEIVLRKIVSFETKSDQEMKIELDPGIVPAYTQTPVVVHVTLNEPESEDHQSDIEGALVTLTTLTPNKAKTVRQQTTNALGRVVFDLMPLPPATKLTFKAEKPEYFADPVEIRVDGNILVFEPDELVSNLQTSVQTEETLSVDATNKIGLDLELATIALRGNFGGILDQTQMANYLQQLQGHVFKANETETLAILRTALSDAVPIFQNQSIKASLFFDVENPRIQQRLPVTIPVTINVSLFGVPENESCLIIDETSWNSSTQDNQIQHSFILTNNCKVNGKPVLLSNLAAELTWNSDIVGNVELTLTQSSNARSSNVATLLPGEQTVLFDSTKTGDTYYGVLTFTPKSDKIGKSAEFEVNFLGTVPSEAGIQTVTAQQPISASISIINFETCLQYTASGANLGPTASNVVTATTTQQKNFNSSSTIASFATNAIKNDNPISNINSNKSNPVVLASFQSNDSGDSDEVQVVVPFGSEGSLTIDSSDCGDIALDIVLCLNDSGCTGGSSEGSISLSTDRFTLSPDNASKTIKVTGENLPGAYGITVSARPKGRDYKRVGIIDVIVEPDPELAFDLSKYKFFLKGIGAKDSAILTNNEYTTIRNVQASTCAFELLAPKPDEENGGGFLSPGMLLGLGLAPAAIPLLADAMTSAFNGGKALGDATGAAQKTATDAAKNAEAANEEALEQTQSVQEEAQGIKEGELAKSVEETTKVESTTNTAITNAKTAATKCKGAVNEQPVKDALTAHRTQLDTVENAMDSSLDNFANAVSNQTSALNQATQSLTQTANSRGFNPVTKANAATELPKSDVTANFQVFFPPPVSLPTSPTNVDKASAILQQGQQGLTTAAAGSGQAASAVDSAIQSQTNGISSVNDMIMGIGEKQTKLTNLETALTTMGGQVDALPEAGTPAEIAACKAAKTTAKSDIEKAKTAVGTAKTTDGETKTATQELSNGATAAKDVQNSAKQATLNAQQAQSTAATQNGNASQAAEVASHNAGGANGVMTAQLLQQGLMMGLMAGLMQGAFDASSTDEGENPCDQKISYPVQADIINLGTNPLGILVDNANVNGEYKREELKVYGEHERQSIGVQFENTGLDGPDPAYGAVVFQAIRNEYPQQLDFISQIIGERLPFAPLATGSLGIPSVYEQKFHLKFVTGDFIQPLPPINSETFSCTQGALIGRTGPGALPRVKLSWNWNDIALNQCDASSDDYTYCDATQFAIMVSKRINAVQTFLNQNNALACPENPWQTQLQNEVDGFNEFLPGVGVSPIQIADHVDGCWVPKTTDLLDGRPGLSYYVLQNEANIQWTTEVPHLQALESLLNFDAYLIQDGFSADFINDFSDYYTRFNFSDTPAFFYSGASAANLDSFFETNQIRFKQKFVESDQLPTSGLYAINLVLDFNNDSWNLFDESNQPDASIRVDLLAIKQTALNSPFYYLPFDGQVGIQGSKLNRQGYGVSFDVAENQVFSLSRQTNVRTLTDGGSNAIQKVAIERESALENLNARASQRGFLLDISSTSNNSKQLRFSPALATPVLMKISHEATTEPFNALYVIRNNGIPETTGNTLTYWSGAGACRDFGGDLVVSAFDEKPDRKAIQSDSATGWEFAYIVDWPKAIKGGDVFLKTIFYTPINMQYALTTNDSKVRLSTPDQSGLPNVNLQGISSMAFNRSGLTDTDRVTAVDDLFSLVEQGHVCVTNTGVRSSFWWNPKSILEQTGTTGQSIDGIAKGLNGGTTCIG